jgi:MFS family permease
LRVLIDLRVWWFSFVYTMITLALYGIIYWLPTVVKGFGTTGTQNGLLNAIPWAVAAIVLVWLPRQLREHRTVLIGMAAIALCGMVAFFSSTLLTENWMRYVALAIGTPCVSLMFPCMWYLPSQIFKGAHAAAAIAAISTIGSLGGFAAQNLMPWVAGYTGSALAAMSVPALSLGILAASALGMLATWHVVSKAESDAAAALPIDAKPRQALS